MANIVIHLSDNQFERLKEMACRLNVSVEELASAKVLDLLKGTDKQFEQAAHYVLNKNAELYRRLARPAT